jgi:hypothetical protein
MKKFRAVPRKPDHAQDSEHQQVQERLVQKS